MLRIATICRFSWKLSRTGSDSAGRRDVVANTNHSNLESRSTPSDRFAPDMYVCLCKCVTDGQLTEAAVGFVPEPGNSRAFAEQVADRLGAGLGCGTCREFALDLVERAATRQISIVLPDRTAPGTVPRPGAHQELPFRLESLRNERAPAPLRG